MKPGQKVIVALRKMIASGELKDGERIAEIPTAAALGVSRMPVRTALRALEQEGLVVRLGARGYAARGPTAEQIEGAIEVRGVLEGLAARQVAINGLSRVLEARLADCLAEGAGLFAKGALDEGDLDRFSDYNLAFHDTLIAASGNPAIAFALRRNNHLPFASAQALALNWDDRPSEFRHLAAAHRQHQAVFDAIKKGDADEAERIMRAHARAAIAGEGVFERLGIEAHATAGAEVLPLTRTAGSRD